MSQRQQILSMLENAGDQGVTGNQFYAACLPRFAARIKELRDQGYVIYTERLDANHFVYKLRVDSRHSLRGPKRGLRAAQEKGREGGVIHASSSPHLASGTDGCEPLDRDPVAVSSGRCLNPYEYENEAA